MKYSTADLRNKVGLRELLMEPVQRIPRYTLMFRTMLKHMGATDPQRARLQEADEIASRIALAEADDHTKRAATLYSLAGAIDDFPVALVSNSRHLLACIDVQDVIAPDPFMAVSSSGPAAALVLHCTLFLFDDKLVIVKRPAEKSGRTLAGLDVVERPARGGAQVKSARKSGLVSKGVVDITDVVATDVGGAGLLFYALMDPKCSHISQTFTYTSKVHLWTSPNGGQAASSAPSQSSSLRHPFTSTRNARSPRNNASWSSCGMHKLASALVGGGLLSFAERRAR